MVTDRSPEARLRQLIADDAYAMQFQTMGQYRTALLRILASFLGDSGPAMAVDSAGEPHRRVSTEDAATRPHEKETETEDDSTRVDGE